MKAEASRFRSEVARREAIDHHDRQSDSHFAIRRWHGHARDYGASLRRRPLTCTNSPKVTVSRVGPKETSTPRSLTALTTQS